MRSSCSTDDMTAGASGLDVCVELLLVGLLVFMPLAFGVVQAWSEQVLVVVAGAMLICLLLKFVAGADRSIVWTWAYIPVAFLVVVVALQLVPLPAWLVGFVSPNTVALRTRLLGDLEGSGRQAGWMQLSLYPNATAHDLRILLSLTAVFFVVLNVFRRPAQIKRLLAAITVTGSVVAALAIAQGLFGNGKLYWFVPTEHCRGFSGPFVNHSHFGQFMNLSIGAAFALLMVKLREAFAGRNVTWPVVFEYVGSSSARPLWLLTTVIGFGAATVFLCLSRGAIISMLSAFALTALVVGRRRGFGVHGWVMVAIAVLAFVCVLYTGFDGVYSRLATLRDFRVAGADRFQMLTDTTDAWTRFPVLGTGLGTYSLVFPMFDRTMITALATHAENEYAQVLAETGVIGLACLVSLAVIVWRHWLKTTSCGRLPVQSAAYGLGFGLVAVLIHSLSDFGQHLPANASLSAIFCGLLLTLGNYQNEKSRHAERGVVSSGLILSRSGGFAILLGVCGLWGWVLRDANNSRLAASYWSRVRNIEKRVASSDHKAGITDNAQLIWYAEKAHGREPTNVRYAYWLAVYRWRQLNCSDSKKQYVHRDIDSAARQIISQLHKVCELCPTYGPAYSTVGQIEKFVLNDADGARQIRKGFELAPSDPAACFAAGRLDIEQGRYDACVAKFQRAVKLDRGLFGAVAEVYVNYLSRPRLAIEAAGDDVGLLRQASELLAETQYCDLAAEAVERIKKLLVEKCSQADAPACELIMLARIYREEKDNEAAIEYYRRALTADYGQVGWRVELAELLAATANMPEAIEEARRCLRVQPAFEPAQKLLTELYVRGDAFDTRR